MKQIDYTKEFLKISKQFYQATTRIADLQGDMKETLRQINDNNILHQKESTKQHQDQDVKLSEVKVSIEDFRGFLIKQLIGTFVMVLQWVILALIVLAGVRQIFQFLRI